MLPFSSLVWFSVWYGKNSQTFLKEKKKGIPVCYELTSQPLFKHHVAEGTLLYWWLSVVLSWVITEMDTDQDMGSFFRLQVQVCLCLLSVMKLGLGAHTLLSNAFFFHSSLNYLL